MATIRADDPDVVAAVDAIHRGDVADLIRLLELRPQLAMATIGSGDDSTRATNRTLLHVVTDWPGHFPRGAESIAALVTAGADVNARFGGTLDETPLHWAASGDDLSALDALIDAGADIEARGAVIGGGTPMADATAFGQWKAARRLLERGASTTLWEASALGLLDRVEGHFISDPLPEPGDITASLWGACHGGHRRVAAFLLEHGADMNWVGWDDLTPLDVAQRSGAHDVITWLRRLGAKTAAEVV